MNFINKQTNKLAGNTIVDDFLNENWNENNNSYSNIGYKDFNFSDTKTLLKTLLISEQNNLCCYCMRRLVNGPTTTLEHIIPFSTSNIIDFNKYTQIPIINDNVVLQSSFESATSKQTTPPFPHTVAYENIIASCDGKVIDGVPKASSAKFCNNKRGNLFIEPLFYIENIGNEIEYKKGGFLFTLNAGYDDTIVNLNLNYETLQKIRQVWYHLSVEKIVDIESADTEEKRNVILTINLMSLQNANRRNQLISDYKTDQFWTILLQYKWFYNYYKLKYHNS